MALSSIGPLKNLLLPLVLLVTVFLAACEAYGPFARVEYALSCESRFPGLTFWPDPLPSIIELAQPTVDSAWDSGEFPLYMRAPLSFLQTRHAYLGHNKALNGLITSLCHRLAKVL